MNKRRLLKLADLLEADAKNKKGVKFDLSLWAKVDDLDYSTSPDVIEVGCQTTACAIGLACISGAFKLSGLAYDLVAKESSGGNNIVPRYRNYRDFPAIQKFFGITEDQADHLFLDSSYADSRCRGARGERAVAARIRSLVAGRLEV